MMQEVLLPSTRKIFFTCDAEWKEPLIALLSESGYYAFEENPEGIVAYIEDRNFSAEDVNDLLEMGKPFSMKISEQEVVLPKDWNEEWEKNFKSVVVDNFCEVHPPFSEPAPGIQYAVKIWPKMAFGTGHHATTRMVISLCRGLDFRDKNVLDMGCGTAVLAILASKLGAQHVDAVDNDGWAYENSIENVALNSCKNIDVIAGTSENCVGNCYDIILANINRNVLMKDRDAYQKLLNRPGFLIISGFLTEDLEMITSHFKAAGFSLISSTTELEWSAIALDIKL